MGADLVLAFAPVTRASKEELIKRIDNELDDLDFVIEIRNYFYDPDLTIEAIRDRLLEAVDEIVFNERRDLAILFFGEDALYVTGGMTWGDDPTEAYKHVQLLGNTRITDDDTWSDGHWSFETDGTW